MSKTLAFIHTSPVLVPAFSRLAQDLLPGIETFHVVDESLIRNTIRAGELTKTTVGRVVKLIGHAHEGGADAVMVTCSSIGPSIDVARLVYDFPVFRIDEAMAEKAVATADTVGVAATLSTTLEPTIALLERTAKRAGREVRIVPHLCEGAFAAVLSGDTARHDRMVEQALHELAPQVDVIVLAQASMARVAEAMGPGAAAVLSSPELAVRSVREALLAPAGA
jgi:Asp/Glu/hydantoin racemase